MPPHLSTANRSELPHKAVANFSRSVSCRRMRTSFNASRSASFTVKSNCTRSGGRDISDLPKGPATKAAFVAGLALARVTAARPTLRPSRTNQEHKSTGMTRLCTPLHGNGIYVAPAELHSISMPWNSRLRHPIALADGRTLRTLADARDVVLSLPERDQRQPKWQQLADLLLSAAAADNASLTAIVTQRIEEALRLSPFGIVALAEKKPAAKSVRRRKARMRKLSGSALSASVCQKTYEISALIRPFKLGTLIGCAFPSGARPKPKSG
jgi:hypothetical protein